MGSGDLELRVAWQQYVATGPAADAALEALLRRHLAPGRHYHDVRHVRWVVRHVLDLADDSVSDLGAVVAAAFFHDAVYGGGGDDERASAELAERTLTELGWHPDRCARVAQLVMTTTHRTPPADWDGAVLVAADLAVLAAAPTVYADYVRSVRNEYGHLDERAWRAGRTDVLRAFLERPTIFPAELGLDSWERRARANLTAEAAALR
jgi:predicted metal-dependent HD superfamily phosphohydrolase